MFALRFGKSSVLTEIFALIELQNAPGEGFAKPGEDPAGIDIEAVGMDELQRGAAGRIEERRSFHLSEDARFMSSMLFRLGVGRFAQRNPA